RIPQEHVPELFLRVIGTPVKVARLANPVLPPLPTGARRPGTGTCTAYLGHLVGAFTRGIWDRDGPARRHGCVRRDRRAPGRRTGAGCDGHVGLCHIIEYYFLWDYKGFMPQQLPRAYSYIRMSTPEQRKGDSLRRQLNLSAEYAAKHSLELVDDARLRD